MDHGLGKIKVIPDHFRISELVSNSLQSTTSLSETQLTSPSRYLLWKKYRSQIPSYYSFQDFLIWFRIGPSQSWTRRKLKSASFMLNLFSLRGLPWGSGSDSPEKVVLSAAEVESLRSEVADLEEREAHLKAQLEHIDEILRSARLSGYLHIRTRWTALPGEPPPIDDTDVDDWLPRFVVLHGACIFFFLMSTDLSPQDSTLLADIVEIGPLPNVIREDGEPQYAFYILTQHGLRFECSSISMMQVKSWLLALSNDCKTGSETSATA